MFCWKITFCLKWISPFKEQWYIWNSFSTESLSHFFCSKWPSKSAIYTPGSLQRYRRWGCSMTQPREDRGPGKMVSFSGFGLNFWISLKDLGCLKWVVIFNLHFINRKEMFLLNKFRDATWVIDELINWGSTELSEIVCIEWRMMPS